MEFKKRHRCALLALFFLTACAWSGGQRHLGHALEPADRHALAAAAGEHAIATNTFTLQETYRLDPAAGRIHLAGRIQYSFDEDTHWLGAIVNRLRFETIYIQVLFADRAGTVIGVDAFRLYPEGTPAYPVAFDRVAPLPPGSAFMTFRLTTYLRDGATRMISRQINATQTDETGGVDHGAAGIGWMGSRGAAAFPFN